MHANASVIHPPFPSNPYSREATGFGFAVRVAPARHSSQRAKQYARADAAADLMTNGALLSNLQGWTIWAIS